LEGGNKELKYFKFLVRNLENDQKSLKIGFREYLESRCGYVNHEKHEV